MRACKNLSYPIKIVFDRVRGFAILSKRPTIADLAAAAGVSIATVDRVLNRRHPVRGPTAERVLAAAEAIGFHAAPLLKQRVGERPAWRFGFLLLRRGDAFYQQLAQALEAAARRCATARVTPLVDYMDEGAPAFPAERIRALGRRADALAVVAVDHPHVSEAIAELRASGVPTFAIITDLTAEARAGYIGRDNRKEGRTAAWMITRTARRPGRIGILVGSHRYLCQETAEISFRSYVREHAPDFTVLEALVNLEDRRIARAATEDLLARHRDLVGIYVAGGGQEGVVEAVRVDGADRGLAIVCNDLMPATRAGLIDGILTAVIATDCAEVARRTVEAMAAAAADPPGPARPQEILVPFDLLIAENL